MSAVSLNTGSETSLVGMSTSTTGGASMASASGGAPATTTAAAPTAGASATSSSDAASSAASSVPVTAAVLKEALLAHKEWARAVVFDQDAHVVALAGNNAAPLAGEVAAWLTLFDKREDTIAAGIVFQNEQFDVHRFHPPLVYGRRGDPMGDDSEGIAVCQVEHETSKRRVFCLITYTYPTLSARAVPQLKAFCETMRTWHTH